MRGLCNIQRLNQMASFGGFMCSNMEESCSPKIECIAIFYRRSYENSSELTNIH